MFGKVLILSFVIIKFSFIWGQDPLSDSAKLEKNFLSSIGKPNVIDSIEKATFQSVKGSYMLEDTYWYNLSKTRFLSGQLDKSFDASSKGIAHCLKNKKKYKTAKFHNIQASVFAYQQKNKKAIASFKKALALLEENNNFKTAASVRNNIANIFFGLSDYKSAYDYSSEAYAQLKKIKDTVNLPGVTGILAVSALKLGKKKEGIRLAKESIALATKYKNPIGLIVGNHSLGEAYIIEEKYTDAIASLVISLELSTLYQKTHFIMLNKLAMQHAYLMDKQYAKSVRFGLEALEETQQLKNENTLVAINKNLGFAYEGLGQHKKAFEYMALAHELYIASAGTENQKAINDILIKYDTEKKEKELIASRLENAESQNKLYKRMQWIILLGTLLGLVLLSYLFYNRLQKQRLLQLKKEQESKRLLASISAEEKERERISNELHDGMASTITGIKLKLEGLSMEKNGLDLKPLVGQLQALHDETRRMSHNLMPLGLNEENWIERMEQYCGENSLPSFKIVFNNNIKTPLSIPTNDSILLYRSMQELIHNAQKHSKSAICHVQVSRMMQDLILTIEDEGIGFKEGPGDSQGLKSMRKRLSEMNAEMEIDSRENQGTLVTLTLPF